MHYGGSASSITLRATYRAISSGTTLAASGTQSNNTFSEFTTNGSTELSRVELTQDGGDLSVSENDDINCLIRNTASLSIHIHTVDIVYQ